MLAGIVKILCRQPKYKTAHFKSISSLFKARNDSRWQKLITSYDLEAKQPTLGKINQVTKESIEEVVKLQLHCGKDIICTTNTEILTHTGFKAIKDLDINEPVGILRNVHIWWTSIERISVMGLMQTYDLDIKDQPKIFIANGFLIKARVQ